MVVSFPVGTRVVENNRDYRTLPDRGVGLERAMAVTAFRDLQRAGLISSSARLSDAPPASAASGTGLAGTSYEARMVSLIRDADGNGRLELDVERLRSSGMLTGSPTADQVERAIAGAPRATVSDTFLRSQTETSRGIAWDTRGSDLTSGRVVNARGREVQRHSTGLVMQTDAERRAREDPAVARRTADSAIAGAQLLESRSPADPAGARTLLTNTGDTLLRAGRLDDAERVYRELQRAPHAGAPVNLMQGEIDRARAASSCFDPTRHVLQFDNNGTHTEVTPRNYASTYGDVATRRLDQISQTRSMQAVVGPDADPHDLSQVRRYMTDYARTHSTEQVSGEYQRYLQNFYAHSGNNGVTWRSDVPLADRGARAQELTSGQPADASGRRIIDCEGYAAITDHVFRDMPGADGRPRFAVMHAGRDDHVIAGVADRDGRFFTVNNDQARMTPPGTRPSAALGDMIANGHTEVIHMGPTPADAVAVREGSGEPVPGGLVWSAARGGPIAVVDDQWVADYNAARRDSTSMRGSGMTILIGGPTAQQYATWRHRDAD